MLSILNCKSSGWLPLPPQAGAYDRFVSRRFEEGPCGWIQPVGSSPIGITRRIPPPRFQGRGVDLKNLRSLRREKFPAMDLLPTKLALANARSVVNKTFILNDFIMSHELDFLFLSETWLKVGDSSPLSELLPEGYVCFNSPRLSGRGGGLMTIYKKLLNASCSRLYYRRVLNYNCLKLQLQILLQLL